jgi:major membrane immunogen (membrane-anchored lipoprotein)
VVKKTSGQVKERKVKKNSSFVLVCLGVLVLSLSGCGAVSYRDGVYSGKSDADDTGAYGEVTITIAAGKVTGCDFVTWQKDGSPKDENYGKVNGEISNQDYYDKAQLAVRAMAQYAEKFRETGDLKSLDAVSGATIAYNQFVEAAELALRRAKN